MFARLVSGLDADGRKELLDELAAPLDPMKQAEAVFAEVYGRG